jgi:6-hydroxycyclohex-1-ene-1-carbonyl-CoA dehydrogenase
LKGSGHAGTDVLVAEDGPGKPRGSRRGPCRRPNPGRSCSRFPPHGRIVLECSGTAAGQETAYALLTYDGKRGVVGFTLDKVSLRLSNLVAFDATAFGNWGCLPDHFPAILRLIQEGRIELKPFLELHPMSRLNDLLREGGHARRPVLIPDFEG